MFTQVLGYETGVACMSWPEAVAALRAGHQRPRPEQADVLLGNDEGRLLNRSARIEGMGFAVKCDSIFPANSALGLPSIHGAVLLFSAQTGQVEAVIDSRLITQWKTAADSLLGAQCLARPESRHLVIVGAGVVAETLARAYDAVFALERISVWARKPAQAEALCAKLTGLKAKVQAAPDLPEALKDADIVSCATMAQTPVLQGAWLRAGTHVDLVGAYTPQMREADDALIAASLLYADFTPTVMDRIGEVMAPIASGAISREHLRGDLYDLVAKGFARETPEQITAFKNGGGAHLDLMMARYALAAVQASKTA